MRHDESGDNEDESACVIGGEREGENIIDVITSRLLLIFPEIFRKIHNPIRKCASSYLLTKALK